MPYELPFAKPYPAVPDGGYWDKVTSTIDWCEENYVVTPYIAEAINTLSNSVFILLAVYAMYSAIKNKLEKRFFFISAGFGLVGIGSWLFHMTLHYEFQLLDELPMIYATCIPMWSVFSEGVSKKQSVTIGTSVLIGANLLTAVYLYLKDPTIHQVAYALLNVFIAGRSHYLTRKYVTDETTRNLLFKTMLKGTVTFLFGYFLWNLDVHFCNQWIALRRSIGMPYGFFFELHAWWHVLTGTGVYFYVVYLEFLRINLLKQGDQYELVNNFGFLSEVRLIESRPKSD